MATYSNGERFVEVKQFSATRSTNGSDVVYTVPVGRYGKLNLQRASASGGTGNDVTVGPVTLIGPSTGANSYGMLGQGLRVISGSSAPTTTNEIVLYEGETVVLNLTTGSGTVSVDFVVREFASVP